MNKVIVITGPTGTGKTKLSLELAKLLDGEIINADSTQVYKGLDIATAKVKDKEGIQHHLIDIKNIDEDYTVYDYQKDGRVIIDDILKRKKTPIVVGGTGLYIKALLYDYKFNEEEKKDYSDLTILELYNRVKKLDNKVVIDKSNRQRLERALAYMENNNKKISEREVTDKLLYDCIFIGLNTDRDNLYKIINARVDDMIEEGLIEEAKHLYDNKYFYRSVMTPIGYKELFKYFDNELTKEEAINLIKQKSRNYAKKQITWCKHQMKINWFIVDYNNFNNTVKEVFNYVKNK